MKITSPYSFIPLNHHVFYPAWSKEVSHDYPFSDSEDGIIEVNIHTVSPFFSRDAKYDTFSSHVLDEDGKRRYFIPATTIKGLLRELVEIMSFGKMQEGKDYQNRYFGWRDVGKSTDSKKSKEYVSVIAKGKAGWLRKEGDNYTYTPCYGKLEKIQITEVKKLFPHYRTDTSVWKVNTSVENKTSPTYPEVEWNGETYRLVCTGKMDGKKHELLFPAATDQPMAVDSETIVAFKTLYANAPGFAEEAEKGRGCYLMALEKGEPIPVFRVNRNVKVYLGMSKMFRIPFKYNVREQVETIQKADPDKADLAETLFGFSGKEDALKGRVMVGHAFMKGYVDDDKLIETSGILGGPKASYYPLYLKQSQSPYKTYDDLVGIAGRKLYRIHRRDTTTALPQGENKNMRTTLKAIPAGQTFHLRIVLHNVRPMETGAVLAALTLNGTDGTFFNLGLAKSYGFGKCKVGIDDVCLSVFSHDAVHYMREFEKMMSVFTYSTTQQLYVNTESMTQVVNILSEHDDDDVRLMNLDGYRDGKSEKKFQFCLLQDGGKPMASHLDANEREAIAKLAMEAKEREAIAKAKAEMAKLYDNAQGHVDAANTLASSNSADMGLDVIEKIINELEEGQKTYNQIIDRLKAKHLPSDEEKTKADTLDKMLADWKQKEADKKKDLEEEKKKRKLTAGLSAELDKLAGDRVSYSVKEFKVCFERVEKWLKCKGTKELTPSEQTALENTAKRILKEPKKKEQKDLKDFEKGKTWHRMSEYLGVEKSRALFDIYISNSDH